MDSTKPEDILEAMRKRVLDSLAESTRLAESVAPGLNPGKRAVGEVRQVEGANPRWRTRAASPRPGGTSSPGGAPPSTTRCYVSG
ncbi:hypothetical protein [Sulfodiicoccus acidiphilus]|uniref:hypothetical protein n=1 Tax=Sulfodiicoccus acidiphilus TaxID=1670455 RepID=UPI000F83F019|nr:hypothetical protein [Sulfodiicoccus acidiphilus]